jgi:hypothetical protein
MSTSSSLLTTTRTLWNYTRYIYTFLKILLSILNLLLTNSFFNGPPRPTFVPATLRLPFSDHELVYRRANWAQNRGRSEPRKGSQADSRQQAADSRQ